MFCIGWQGQCPQCPGLQTKTSKKRVTLGMVNTAQLQPDYVQDQVPEEKLSSQYSCRYVYNSSVKQSILVNEIAAKNLHGKNGLVTVIVLNL